MKWDIVFIMTGRDGKNYFVITNNIDIIDYVSEEELVNYNLVYNGGKENAM